MHAYQFEGRGLKILASFYVDSYQPSCNTSIGGNMKYKEKTTFIEALIEEFRYFAIDLTRSMGDEADKDHLQHFLECAEAFVVAQQEENE